MVLMRWSLVMSRLPWRLDRARIIKPVIRPDHTFGDVALDPDRRIDLLSAGKAARRCRLWERFRSVAIGRSFRLLPLRRPARLAGGHALLNLLSFPSRSMLLACPFYSILIPLAILPEPLFQP